MAYEITNVQAAKSSAVASPHAGSFSDPLVLRSSDSSGSYVAWLTAMTPDDPHAASLTVGYGDPYPGPKTDRYLELKAGATANSLTMMQGFGYRSLIHAVEDHKVSTVLSEFFGSPTASIVLDATSGASASELLQMGTYSLSINLVPSSVHIDYVPGGPHGMALHIDSGGDTFGIFNKYTSPVGQQGHISHATGVSDQIPAFTALVGALQNYGWLL